MRRNIFLIVSLVVLIVLLFFLNLLLGTVEIPARDVFSILMGGYEGNEIWRNIVLQSRVPQALTALVAGAGLAVSGLQMQTVFHNPLAGPSVLGISNGASLGVAFVVLLSGSIGGTALSRLGYMGDAAISISAIIGALAVMGLIVYVSQKVKGHVTLLIIGVMIGYLVTAIVGVLLSRRGCEGLRGMGIRKFRPCVGWPDDAVCLTDGCITAPQHAVGENHEPASPW